ncbi:hypothetical protein EYZ11_001189 [Aspergillus tanneri]|uniref:Cell division control protein n=1 Tax=Aspergillus tanneri TaxID=1220188 RepID=A0A4S3JV73_9EURO|nr:hypothetical protein EYZ11_001189 [Aspergillus tanneri]
MVASVLGKRQRGAIETEVPSLPLRSASKRRTQPPHILREGTEPSVSPARQLRSKTRKAGALQHDNGNNTEDSFTLCEQSGHVGRERDRAFNSLGLDNDENSRPVQLKTPSKSRYRNALESPPITPKHKVQVGGKSLTPRTPRPTSAPTTAQTVYTNARQLFARGANSAQLVGRDDERGKLSFFIQNGVESGKGGCLYVSGPPGTGKSAMVQEVCRALDPKSVKVAHLNCASMRSARDVYSKLIEDLCEDHEVFKKSEADRLKSLFIPDKKQNDLFLVTLDEIDHLLTADTGVLQSLFEWSLHSKSKLMLIGIANALDLTDRSLPQLKAKNLKPRLLPFLPYNAGQIANVITNRLRSLLPQDQNEDPNFVPFAQPAAIMLCAKKVASQAGDLRKAFELVKRAIDIVEQETMEKLEKRESSQGNPSKTILVENNNLSSPARAKQPSSSTYNVFTAPRASIAHIARVTSSAFGQGTVQRLKNLNLQQKAAICALIALDRKKREGEYPSTPSKSRSAEVEAEQFQVAQT